MVQGPSLAALEAICNPSSIEHRLASLKLLKNDIVGHDQRKELVVKQGVIEPLVAIVKSPKRSAGKQPLSTSNGVSLHGYGARSPWTTEDEARLQATLILGSLASGGPAFLTPLSMAGTTKCLLDVLSRSREIQPRLVTATLQALRSIAASATALAEEDQPLVMFESDEQVDGLHLLLQQYETSNASKQQVKLVAEIVALAVTTDETADLLVRGGLIDVFASLLASYAIAHHHIQHRGPLSHLPEPPPAAAVPSILMAVASLVRGSNYRIQSFILAPEMRDLFAAPWRESGPCIENSNDRIYAACQSPAESLLPPLHVPTFKTVSFHSSAAFPALGTLQTGGDRKVANAWDTSHYGGHAEHANAVCAWLLFLARSMQGMDRAAALQLLALVNNAVEADTALALPRSDTAYRTKERERQMAMLAVPLAVKLAQGAAEGKSSEHGDTAISSEREQQELRERACEVLALLIENNKDLQTAAVDAGAIKRVCPILKKSFDAVTIAKPMWSSRASREAEQLESPAASRKMGRRGLPPEIMHAMQCRKTALEALAALAKREDLHRKAIVDAGVVTCIIDSLIPFECYVTTTDTRQQVSPKDGNTVPVILAACHAAQSLSRSVSLLRTSLIDAGIAKPIFQLLTHPNRKVQVAATDVSCNLLLEFSPMKEDLLAAGAVKTLTEHARQSEMGLRLSSLWALKHLVLASPREVKVHTLEELGTGWLVGAIAGQHRPSIASGGVSLAPVGVPVVVGGLSAPNAAGEQVDLLNPATNMEVDEEDDVDDDEDGEVLFDESSATHYQSSSLRSTLRPPFSGAGAAMTSHHPQFDRQRYLTSVRNAEYEPTLLAVRDDIAVQEQALDFVRNMLNGDDCASMFEHLMQQIGSEKMFALLTEKLSPAIDGSTGDSNGISSTSPAPNFPSNSARPIYRSTSLVLSTVHVITHIANASPAHKSLLIAQTPLLKAWLPHFSHPDRRVRVACVWAVNNLTWVEDEGDRSGARARVEALRAVGIVDAISALTADHDYDVCERVKVAVRQIEGL